MPSKNKVKSIKMERIKANLVKKTNNWFDKANAVSKSTQCI